MAKKSQSGSLQKVQNKILNREPLDDKDGVSIAKEVRKRVQAKKKAKESKKR